MKTIKDQTEDFIMENWRWLYAIEIRKLKAGKEIIERMKEVVEERKQLIAHLTKNKAELLMKDFKSPE